MKSDTLKLYRKRYVPMEIVHLKNDTILELTNDVLVTTWRSIKPRKDIFRGVSAYYLSRGFKISKILDSHDKLVYWYCDIAAMICNEADNSITCEDLLLDVLVYENGQVKLLDITEAADTYEHNIITKAQLVYAMRKLDELLSLIYSGEFRGIQDYINTFDNRLRNSKTF